MKIKVDDLQEIEYRLTELGAKLKLIANQRDIYYSHPMKDYAKTDEALRIREDSDKVYLTYKGPKFDSKSKTRVEINVEFSNVQKLMELLEHLGFKRVLIISKERKIYEYEKTEFCLDEVEGLGSYLEVERILPNKEHYQKTRAELEKQLIKLKLDPNESIRESYLELLIAKK